MTVTEAPTGSVLVYVLAAPEDEELCGKIRKHLKPQVRTSDLPIELVDDFDVPPAEDRTEYRERLLEADVVLPLISVDLIDDDDTYERSQAVLQRFNAGQNVLVSVIVRNCVLKNIPLAQPPVIVLPANRLPINSRKHWPDEDDAITSVAHEICDTIAEIVRAELAERKQSAKAGATAMRPVDPVAAPSATERVADDDVAAVASRDSSGAPSTPPEQAAEHVADTASERTAQAEAAAKPAPSASAAVEEAEATALTRAEWAPPVVAAPSASSTPRPTATRTALARPLDVDWRSQYYRRVVWKRCFAYVIDSVLFAYLPLLLFGLMAASVTDPNEDPPAALSFAMLIAFLWFPFGLPYLESRNLGTPGKRMLGLQITGRDGARISYWRAFGRNLLRSVTFYSYVLIIPLIYQRKRFRTTKKLFHDEWSKTVIGEHLPG